MPPSTSVRTAPPSSHTMLEPSLTTREGISRTRLVAVYDRGAARPDAARTRDNSATGPYPVNDGEVTPVFGFVLGFFFLVAGLRLAFVHHGFAGTPAHGFGFVTGFLG